MLVEDTLNTSYRTTGSIVSSAVTVLAATASCCLSYVEHFRSYRPSSLLQLYLLVALATQVVHLRSTWLRRSKVTPNFLSLFQVASCAGFLAAESTTKKSILLGSPEGLPSPETLAGIFGQRLLLRLNSLFRRGFKKVLGPKDLIDVDSDLVSETTHERFREVLLRQAVKNRKRPLLFTIVSVLRYALLMPVLPRLLMVGVNFAQPFLIQAVVEYIDTRNSDDDSLGPWLIVGTVLTYIGIAVFQTWYRQTQIRFQTQLRGCLVSALYDKALRTRPCATFSPVMLMNVDAEQTLQGLGAIHDFFASILTIGISLYLMYSRLGLVFLAPIALLIILAAITAFVSTQTAPRRKIGLAATQKRVSFVTDVVASMKGIKLLGLGPTIGEIGSNLRRVEVEKQNSLRRMFFITTLVSQSITRTAHWLPTERSQSRPCFIIGA